MEAQSTAPALSYTVIGDRRIISRKAGLSVDEIKLASEAAHYIEGLGYPLWYAVVSDQYSAERLNRSRLRRVCRMHGAGGGAPRAIETHGSTAAIQTKQSHCGDTLRS
jgi:hypothetical protein